MMGTYCLSHHLRLLVMNLMKVVDHIDTIPVDHRIYYCFHYYWTTMTTSWQVIGSHRRIEIQSNMSPKLRRQFQVWYEWCWSFVSVVVVVAPFVIASAIVVVDNVIQYLPWFLKCKSKWQAKQTNDTPSQSNDESVLFRFVLFCCGIVSCTVWKINQLECTVLFVRYACGFAFVVRHWSLGGHVIHSNNNSKSWMRMRISFTVVRPI